MLRAADNTEQAGAQNLILGPVTGLYGRPCVHHVESKGFALASLFKGHGQGCKGEKNQGDENQGEHERTFQ